MLPALTLSGIALSSINCSGGEMLPAFTLGGTVLCLKTDALLQKYFLRSHSRRYHGDDDLPARLCYFVQNKALLCSLALF